MDSKSTRGLARAVLIAPDKYKGCLTALEVAACLREGLLSAEPTLDIRLHPVADGGDGFARELVPYGYLMHAVSTKDALGRPTRAHYASRDGTAVIELASASGIAQLAPGELSPLDADSWGTGEVVARAIADGNHRIILGTGGSACTDGGAGLLVALGAMITDVHGNSLKKFGASDLESARCVDLTGLQQRVGQVEFEIAVDVTNPLLGRTGAAAVFGPQKGASPLDVCCMDQALSLWADVLERASGRHCRELPGAGAAGGAAFGLASALGAKIRNGLGVFATLTQLVNSISDVDVVVTGEGCLDQQSLSGKAPVGVLDLAVSHAKPVWAVVGQTCLTSQEIRERGFAGHISLSELEPDLDRSMAHARELLFKAGSNLASNIARDTEDVQIKLGAV